MLTICELEEKAMAPTTTTTTVRPSTMTRTERDRLTSDLRMACMRISRRVRFESTASVAPHQFSVLARLEEKPRTPKELAAFEKVSAPSMTRTVAGLVEAGLVARADDPTDGRQVILSLSPEGRRTIRDIRRRRDAVVRRPAREAHRRRARRAGAGHRAAGTGGGRVSPTFTSLEVRNYRLWAAGALVSNVGTWMGRVGQDWLVLTVLTAGSATALGIVTGLQFLPFLLLAPWAGLIADRFPKRRILLATQTLLALSSLLLGILAVTGAAQLWQVYAIALFQGVVTAIDNPARQAFVSEMVPDDKLANAVSLNSASFNLGRLIGPGLAGVVIALWGVGPALTAQHGDLRLRARGPAAAAHGRAAPGAAGQGPRRHPRGLPLRAGAPRPACS